MRRPSLRRAWLAAGLAVVTGAVVVAANNNTSDRASAYTLNSGSAWFASPASGTAALIDGATGRRLTRVTVAPERTAFSITQVGDDAIAVDKTSGALTRLRAMTWSADRSMTAGTPGDSRLGVYATSDTVWALLNNGTVVQQLDQMTLASNGAPLSAPGSVTSAALAPSGALWTTNGSGDVRAYRNGQVEVSTRISGSTDRIVLAGESPVLVDTGRSRAQVLDASSGRVKRSVCFDVPELTNSLLVDSVVGKPWLIALGPRSGVLMVARTNTGQCQPIPLGSTASEPRYGSPVERNGLVYVPDNRRGEVIIVDPEQLPERQIVRRVNVELPGRVIQLMVHNDRVWFDDLNGDTTGIITDDLEAIVTSKAGGDAEGHAADQSQAEPAPGQNPDTRPRPTITKPKTAGGSSKEEAEAQLDANALDLDASPSGSPDGGDGLPEGNVIPGGDGGEGGGGGPDEPQEVTASFSVTPPRPAAGKVVTLTDTSRGDHKVQGWDLPEEASIVGGGTTSSSLKVRFPAAGTYNVVLTIDTDDGGKSVTQLITVTSGATIPLLIGFTEARARAELNDFDLTASLGPAKNSLIAAGTVLDTNPPAGTSVAFGSNVALSLSNGRGEIKTVGPPVPALARGVTADGNGNAYLLNNTEIDGNRNELVRIAPDGRATTIPLTFVGIDSAMDAAAEPASDGNRNIYFGRAGQVLKTDVNTGITTLFAGNGTCCDVVDGANATASPLGFVTDVAADRFGNVYIRVSTLSDDPSEIVKVDTSGKIFKIDRAPYPQGIPEGVTSIACDSNGVLYFSLGFEPSIYKYIGRLNYEKVVGTGNFGFNGDGRAALNTDLDQPGSISFDPQGRLYFIDYGNAIVRRLDPDGTVHIVAGKPKSPGFSGDNGPADAAQISPSDHIYSGGLAVASDGAVYLADSGTKRIRVIR